jgi:hypothetical protein
MYTGYYVSRDYIHGPAGAEYSGQFYISGNYIHGPKNSGLFYLTDPAPPGPNPVRYVYGPTKSAMYYLTHDGHFYGPDDRLPWLD